MISLSNKNFIQTS